MQNIKLISTNAYYLVRIITTFGRVENYIEQWIVNIHIDNFTVGQGGAQGVE